MTFQELLRKSVPRYLISIRDVSLTLGKSLSATLFVHAMSNKKFMAIDHIAELNRIKKELNKPFTRGVLQKELKKAGIPSNPVFFACLSKYKIIKRVSRAEFVFSNNNPIYYKLLETVYIDYANRLDKYAKKYAETRASKTQKVEEAIQLLKSMGYQIFAPVKDLYALL